MSRLTYLVGVAVLLVAGAFLVTDRLTWRPGVTPRNVRRVREGMTLAEVEAILGKPRDCQLWHDCTSTPIGLEMRHRVLAASIPAILLWSGDGVERGMVWFRGGRVSDICFRFAGPTRPGPLSAVLSRLGW